MKLAILLSGRLTTYEEGYKDIMENLPTYITDSDGANGFIELVDLIFSTK